MTIGTVRVAPHDGYFTADGKAKVRKLAAHAAPVANGDNANPLTFRGEEKRKRTYAGTVCIHLLACLSR